MDEQSAASFSGLVREVLLAVAMICLLVGGLWLHTGTMPPLVVVESSSMVHDVNGEVGSIDAGDLILVHGRNPSGIITFAEASDPLNVAFGYRSHGLEGDVVIYAKNGEEGTPIIHRAILRVVANGTLTPDRTALAAAGHHPEEPFTEEPADGLACPDGGVWDPTLTDAGDEGKGTCIITWDVPGTDVRGQSRVSVVFDGVSAGFYDCKRSAHANAEPHLVVHEWAPTHEGLLTLGDNNFCSVDQGSGATNGSTGVQGASGIVHAVRTEWIVGRAGAEVPWLGVVKLMLASSGPGTQYVPRSAFVGVAAMVAVVLALPMVIDPMFRRLIERAPEAEEAARERAMDLVLRAISEDE